MIKKLSVFFPVFNEEGNIGNTVEKAINVLNRLKIEYEIIIVNDGSIDNTAQVVDSLVKKNAKIRVIHHPQNLGYGEALKSGFYNARYDTVVYTDGDGQFDFSEVTKFLEKIENNDLVIGYRKKRQDPFFRILFKQGWKLSLWAMFGSTLKDVDCGFKMIRREVLEKIPHLESARGAMINPELVIKAKKKGFKIAQVGVNHYPRLSGKPTGANLRVIIKSYTDLLKLWWKLKDQRNLFILFVGILALATFLRFYRLSEYMTFLGDEGRDAIVIKNILVNHHIPLIGPPTSVGNIYLGPLYYYMMAVPMAIFWLNPVAAAGMNALLGVATVAFIYYLGKLWFNRQAGLIASYLYAISPVTVIYSRSSWNPNPAPFFALLSMFSLHKLHQTGNFLWLVLTGFSIGVALQMHYLAAILVPITVTVWLGEIVFRKLNQLKNKDLLSGTILGVLSFIFIMSPLIWFDLRHRFLNYRAIMELFSAGGAVKGDIFANIARMPALYIYNLIGRYIGGENIYLTGVVAVIVIVAFLYKLSNWSKLVLGTWLIIGLFGLSFYQQNVYDHYLGFLNPVPFLLLGATALLLTCLPVKSKNLVNGGVIVLLFALTVVNLQRSPLLKAPNNQLKRTQDVAKFIIGQTGDKPFNFALLSKNNYDAAYQYYLDLYSHKPKQVPFDITDELFVVCEDPVCDPVYSAKYEIAGFGWSKVEWLQNVYGVKLYKLVHNPTGKP